MLPNLGKWLCRIHIRDICRCVQRLDVDAGVRAGEVVDPYGQNLTELALILLDLSMVVRRRGVKPCVIASVEDGVAFDKSIWQYAFQHVELFDRQLTVVNEDLGRLNVGADPLVRKISDSMYPGTRKRGCRA